MGYRSYEITPFNTKTDEQIILGGKCGLLRIFKSEDGRLVLVEDGDHGIIDHSKISPVPIAQASTILGFVLDIGIQKKRELTYGNGFYSGRMITHSQSSKEISQENFDAVLLEKICSTIDNAYASQDPKKERHALRISLLFQTYNHARLQFPSFYSDSYLSMIRILDAIYPSKGAYGFALNVAGVSPDLNREIMDKIERVALFKNDDIPRAQKLFQRCKAKATSKKWQKVITGMNTLDDSAQLVFSCFFSAYQYRSKFVHSGFPFPDNVKDTPGDPDSGMWYLSAARGLKFLRVHRPDGLQKDDLIDRHELLGLNQEDAEAFKEAYLPLLPSWHFLKRIVRAALLEEINKMASKNSQEKF